MFKNRVEELVAEVALLKRELDRARAGAQNEADLRRHREQRARELEAELRAQMYKTNEWEGRYKTAIRLLDEALGRS